MTLKYLYRLNLPNFNEVKLDSFSLENVMANHNIFGCSTSKFLKPAFINLKELKFVEALFFKKITGSQSVIHTDKQSLNESFTRWGINWIEGDAEGGMKYWNEDQVVSSKLTKDSFGYIRPEIEVNSKEIEDFKTKSGCVYLVNASVPHQAYNYNKGVRYAISARPYWPDSKNFESNTPLKWESVVDLFKDLIIDY